MSVPTSSETEAVETIKDLLENIDSSDWSVEPDRFAFMWEFDYNSRTQYSGTAVYLWSPLESDISKFSADGDNFRQDDTVECVVMALDRTDTATIAAEIAENISESVNSVTVCSAITPTKPTTYKKLSDRGVTPNSLFRPKDNSRVGLCRAFRCRHINL